MLKLQSKLFECQNFVWNFGTSVRVYNFTFPWKNNLSHVRTEKLFSCTKYMANHTDKWKNIAPGRIIIQVVFLNMKEYRFCFRG